VAGCKIGVGRSGDGSSGDSGGKQGDKVERYSKVIPRRCRPLHRGALEDRGTELQDEIAISSGRSESASDPRAKEHVPATRVVDRSSLQCERRLVILLGDGHGTVSIKPVRWLSASTVVATSTQPGLKFEGKVFAIVIEHH
jgi:hypothetical protein